MKTSKLLALDQNPGSMSLRDQWVKMSSDSPALTSVLDVDEKTLSRPLRSIVRAALASLRTRLLGTFWGACLRRQKSRSRQPGRSAPVGFPALMNPADADIRPDRRPCSGQRRRPSPACFTGLTVHGMPRMLAPNGSGRQLPGVRSIRSRHKPPERRDQVHLVQHDAYLFERILGGSRWLRSRRARQSVMDPALSLRNVSAQISI